LATHRRRRGRDPTGRGGSRGRALARVQDNAYLQQCLDAVLALPEKPDDAEQATMRQQLVIRRTSTIEGDKAKALALKTAAYGDGWEEDAVQLNEVAELTWREGMDLAEAERLARKAGEMSEVGWRKSRCCDVLAEVLRAQGRLDEAKQALADAVKNNPRDRALERKLEGWTATS
jgi:hypothetical protein